MPDPNPHIHSYADGPVDSILRVKSRQPSRRLAWRIASVPDLWVYWHSTRFGDLSRVRDLGAAGLSIETLQALPVGETVELNFLVPEGQIRAECVVRHRESGSGLGVRFTAIKVEDRPRLAALLARIRGSAGSLREPAQKD